MSVFSTTWVDGKINDINELIKLNPNRQYAYILDTNFIIYARSYVEDKKKFKEENLKIYDEFIQAVEYLRKQDLI